MKVDVVARDEDNEELFRIQVVGDFEVHHSYGPDWAMDKIKKARKRDQVIVIIPEE